MWQSLLRAYLMNQAQQKMREAAMQAAGQTMADEPPVSDQPPEPKKPEICHVGLVFALSSESGGFVDRLAGLIKTEGFGFVAREGGLNGRRMLVIESGVGREAAARATEALIQGHHPQWVISAGFAGGLDERLKQRDILVANSIVDESGHELKIDFKLPPAPKLHVGRLLTVDRVVADPADKCALGEKHAALAVDMETLAVAQVCQQAKVKFLSIRVIIDEVNRTLPRDIDLLVRKKTTAGRLGAAAGAIVRRPGSIKDMWQLKEDALEASEHLAKFLADIVTSAAQNSSSAGLDRCTFCRDSSSSVPFLDSSAAILPHSLPPCLPA
jgi:adenosylhomocysteine nucleosidase